MPNLEEEGEPLVERDRPVAVLVHLGERLLPLLRQLEQGGDDDKRQNDRKDKEEKDKRQKEKEGQTWNGAGSPRRFWAAVAIEIMVGNSPLDTW